MNNYQIITDATCDMNQEILDQKDILVMPMEIVMDDGQIFQHYPDFRNFSADDFYEELKKGNLAHTSQITPAQYLSFFTSILEEGKDILYVCFSSGMSNMAANAKNAAAELEERYPGRNVIAVDSLGACGGEGVLAVRAAENRENGMSIQENAEWLENNKLNLAHYFSVDDLMYLHKGGRVSAATAIVGSALDVKPMMYVDDEGKLLFNSTVRGLKASLKKLIAFTQKSIIDSENQILYISGAECREDAEWLRKKVLEKIPCKDVIITTVGPVIGTHTGPSLICLFSFGTGRKPVSDIAGVIRRLQ